MSLKVDAFLGVNKAPKTADKYLVMLPGLSQALFKVTATSLPFSSNTEGAIWFLGRPFYLPTSRVENGTWTCTYLEDITTSGLIGISILEGRSTQRNVYLGDVTIMATDQFTGSLPINLITLKYAWLVGIEPVELGWEKATTEIAYKLKFRYNAIQRWY